MRAHFAILDEFFPQNLWWVILVAAVVVVGVVLGLVFGLRKKKPHHDSSAYLSALGGKENIVSKERRGSRIVLVCKDYGLIDREALKKAGVTGFIQGTDKMTLVIKEGAERLFEEMFPEER